ncbi:unnamed protein product [Hymenolepis diminuta]|uniref:Uncharacterized protein n=1 Tax=Hymenolepis diminuta TaxID=6216 RepID=A0A564YN06_HYMDI|nr:unnamed protein product [Hymenolepis diminuta]VUZ48667.1 unnamed protein product [Hymenolepis diminuta]
MDPVILSYEKMINKLDSVVCENSSLFILAIIVDENVCFHESVIDQIYPSLEKTISSVSHSFLVFDLLAMLRLESDFCPSWTRNLMVLNCGIFGSCLQLEQYLRESNSELVYPTGESRLYGTVMSSPHQCFLALKY